MEKNGQFIEGVSKSDIDLSKVASTKGAGPYDLLKPSCSSGSCGPTRAQREAMAKIAKQRAANQIKTD